MDFQNPVRESKEVTREMIQKRIQFEKEKKDFIMNRGKYKLMSNKEYNSHTKRFFKK